VAKHCVSTFGFSTYSVLISVVQYCDMFVPVYAYNVTTYPVIRTT